MSYRELRNFIEIIKSLGYSKRISQEDFRMPNFVLVSDLIYWIVQRLHPNLEISYDITTENDRILFLKTIAQQVYYHSRIKLNLKKIYRADGYAVKEILKLAKLLKKSLVCSNSNLQLNSDLSSINENVFQQKISELKELSAELVSIGSELFKNLENEVENQMERQGAVDFFPSPVDIKDLISKNITETKDSAENLKESIIQMENNEKTLKKKKKGKHSELESATKRYNRLATFRPAFMNEYDKKEGQLQELFTAYVDKYRNLEYLEHEFEKYRRVEDKENDVIKGEIEGRKKREKDAGRQAFLQSGLDNFNEKVYNNDRPQAPRGRSREDEEKKNNRNPDDHDETMESTTDESELEGEYGDDDGEESEISDDEEGNYANQRQQYNEEGGESGNDSDDSDGGSENYNEGELSDDSSSDEEYGGGGGGL